MPAPEDGAVAGQTVVEEYPAILNDVQDPVAVLSAEEFFDDIVQDVIDAAIREEEFQRSRAREEAAQPFGSIPDVIREPIPLEGEAILSELEAHIRSVDVSSADNAQDLERGRNLLLQTIEDIRQDPSVARDPESISEALERRFLGVPPYTPFDWDNDSLLNPSLAAGIVPLPVDVPLRAVRSPSMIIPGVGINPNLDVDVNPSLFRRTQHEQARIEIEDLRSRVAALEANRAFTPGQASTAATADVPRFAAGRTPFEEIKIKKVQTEEGISRRTQWEHLLEDDED